MKKQAKKTNVKDIVEAAVQKAKEEEQEEVIDNPNANKGKLFLEKELKYSKSIGKTWGRRVIAAIDIDDPIALYEIFSGQSDIANQASVDINAQSSHNGYGDYMWSPFIHKNLGKPYAMKTT